MSETGAELARISDAPISSAVIAATATAEAAASASASASSRALQDSSGCFSLSKNKAESLLLVGMLRSMFRSDLNEPGGPSPLDMVRLTVGKMVGEVTAPEFQGINGG